jgi:hypothetical protein
MLAETALVLIALSLLPLWLASIAIDDRHRYSERRPGSGPAVYDLTTGRVHYIEILDEAGEFQRVGQWRERTW